MLRSNRRRTVLAAAALVAAATVLTACQGDSDGDRKTRGSGSSSASDTRSASDDRGAGGTKGADAQGGKGSGGKSSGGGVSGTWFGTVSYLAPGKYTVTDLKDTEQAFFTSTDTDIQGAGGICGDAAGQAATPCSEKELEAAARKGVSATVKLKDGIAVSIVEDHSSTGGDDSGTGKASGLRSGELGYLAPGKYTLRNDGSEAAFFSATDTTVNGDGWICGEAGGELTRCTEAELEAAAKKGGVRVVVELEDGVAVTIDEEHN
jgi:hypothetical protein